MINESVEKIRSAFAVIFNDPLGYLTVMDLSLLIWHADYELPIESLQVLLEVGLLNQSLKQPVSLPSKPLSRANLVAELGVDFDDGILKSLREMIPKPLGCGGSWHDRLHTFARAERGSPFTDCSSPLRVSPAATSGNAGSAS